MRFSKGFTLIEVIITIVIMAIVAAAFIAYFGSSFTGSAMQAGQVKRQYELIQKMEEITSDYRNKMDRGMSNTLWATFSSSCPDYNTSTVTCTCNSTRIIGTYETAREHVQVTCTDGNQNVFAIFTQ